MRKSLGREAVRTLVSIVSAALSASMNSSPVLAPGSQAEAASLRYRAIPDPRLHSSGESDRDFAHSLHAAERQPDFELVW
ncbi:hypothetical protein D3C71_1929370 [compost metagenome]